MRAVVFDTETTALIANRTIKDDKLPEVIEFYGCLVDLSTEDPVERELDLLIKPRMPIQPETTRITGITNEMVASAPTFVQVAEQVKSFLEGDHAIVAHNASYDVEVIDIEMARVGKVMKWPRDVICTVEQSVHLKGSRFNLSDLHQHLFGERFADAHRARHDVSALVRVAREMYRREMI
jgi:DNA polymerase-3 subunit epsilon